MSLRQGDTATITLLKRPATSRQAPTPSAPCARAQKSGAASGGAAPAAAPHSAHGARHSSGAPGLPRRRAAQPRAGRAGVRSPLLQDTAGRTCAALDG